MLTVFARLSFPLRSSPSSETTAPCATPCDNTDQLLPPEQVIFNSTQVRINIEGCVHTLRGECAEWLAERTGNGSDGRHPAVYPCHVTPQSDQYVITNYDRQQAIQQMVLAATLPCGFLALSCLSLCLCGKLVSVSKYGVFYCRDCHSENTRGELELVVQTMIALVALTLIFFNPIRLS